MKACVGAIVRYCGHRGVFVADVLPVAGAVAVIANPKVEEILNRNPADYETATHHLVDYPIGGLWQPRKGIFVVPQEQLIDLRKGGG